MTLAELFQAVTAAGVRLSADGEYVYAEPRVAVTEAILGGLCEHKAELLPLLAPPAKAEPEPTPEKLRRRFLAGVTEAWRPAIEDVSAVWAEALAEGITLPQHVPEAEVLEREVELACEVENHPWAVGAIDGWRRAWLDAIADVRR